jgi:hypothetical protein
LDVATFFIYSARFSALRPTANLEDQVHVFMSPSDRVTQLYPQAPGSLFSPSCDSQGYGGRVLTRLHMEKIKIYCDKIVMWNVMRSKLSHVIATRIHCYNFFNQNLLLNLF